MDLGCRLAVGFFEDEVVHDGKSFESNPFQGPGGGNGLKEFGFLCKEGSALWAVGNEGEGFASVNHNLVDSSTTSMNSSPSNVSHVKGDEFTSTGGGRSSWAGSSCSSSGSGSR